MADYGDTELNADLPDDPEEKRTFAYDNGQMTWETINIGVGNFLEETYTDARKVSHTGVRCDFWLRGPNAEERRVRVHPGLELDFEGYHIRVHLLARQNGRWLAGVGIKPQA